ncbi:LOW QUALITY PROTEIN: pathogenesis-related protein PRMS-like [Actinidia eriantha]|uniref:LOW QUALITY PROTEIN: pathogenesis-related protein PRMS-like n=1 Tax=Actinidia eriantha TaxID=165200 RepID=UPI002587563C|nr:LOW QUALITY PROTEIN: pathogenesis-related protein PRMS-like [Actinidia eriantha]
MAFDLMMEHSLVQIKVKVMLETVLRSASTWANPSSLGPPKLAQYAARYAAQRAYDCDLVHSGGPYGENRFWGSGNEWTPTDVVKLWVKEHTYYNCITNKCKPEKMCGHYTQIVWRSSLRLGCARVQCDNGDIFAICSYDPPGNYIGEHPFAIQQ